MTDVTIRGAGIFGLSIAWACQKRGARVRVIDPNGIAAGSSGGIVGALAPHVPENWNSKKAFQFQSLLMAEAFWAEISAHTELPTGYTRAGRLQPIADAHTLDLAVQRSENAKSLWQGQAEWSVITSPPDAWHPLSPTGAWISDTLSAHIHPRRACMALADALTTCGVTIASEGDAKGPTVWATGWDGLIALGQGYPRPLGNGVKGQAALLDIDMSGCPQLFADGVHIVPHLDGTVAIGSTSENQFTSPHETDDLLDAVLEKVRRHVPHLATAQVIKTWAGVRPRARSRAPMLGPWPDRPGHFIANGGFKIGFGMAPKIAEVIADLILENRDEIPHDFRVSASL